MQLLVAHQILIASAIGLAILFGVRSAIVFGHEGGVVNLGLVLGSLVVATALGAYFKTVRAKWRDQNTRR